MSVTPKTLKYRQELKEIDMLIAIPDMSVFELKCVLRRLRSLIKGPFDQKAYQKAYHTKNRDKILKQQAKYRRLK